MNGPFTGIWENIFVPTLWVLIPGLKIGIIAEKKYRKGTNGFLIGASIGLLLTWLIGSWSH